VKYEDIFLIRDENNPRGYKLRGEMITGMAFYADGVLGGQIGGAKAKDISKFLETEGRDNLDDLTFEEWLELLDDV